MLQKINREKIYATLAFGLPFLYWIYLFFQSDSIIVFDAKDYHEKALIFYNTGWKGFLETGPHSPFGYPLMLSLAMRLEDFFSISYLKIQTFFQMLLLFLTQFLSLKLLKRLSIPHWVSYLTVLYLGISPSLTNLAFSLWSEVLIFPLVCAIIITYAQSWSAISKGNWVAFKNAVGLALLFILICNIKAIFEFIFYTLFIPHIYLLFKAIKTKQVNAFKCLSLFLLTLIVLFNSFALPYKYINQSLNGHFVLAGRGPYIFYGNTVLRTEPVTGKDISAALTSVPGEHVCIKFFEKETCDRWKMLTQDYYGLNMLKELREKGIPEENIDEAIISLGKKRIAEHPLQYTLFTILESMKMLFWESTLIGYVRYPLWLDNLFRWTPFKNSLRLLMSALTIMGIFFVIQFIWHQKKYIFAPQSSQHKITALCFSILYFILVYTLFYSLSSIHTRYASPIASLYLIIIAFYLSRAFIQKGYFIFKKYLKKNRQTCLKRIKMIASRK